MGRGLVLVQAVLAQSRRAWTRCPDPRLRDPAFEKLRFAGSFLHLPFHFFQPFPHAHAHSIPQQPLAASGWLRRLRRRRGDDGSGTGSLSWPIGPTHPPFHRPHLLFLGPSSEIILRERHRNRFRTRSAPICVGKNFGNAHLSPGSW